MTPAPAMSLSFPAGPAPARTAVAAFFPGGRAVRTALRALFFVFPLALASIPATAAAQPVPPCLRPEPTPEALFGAAEAMGFVAVDPETAFTPELVDRLSWVLAMPYLHGDSGGEDLATILALQARAAANIARLTPTAKSETRVLANETGVSILRWQNWANGKVTVTCTGADFADEAEPAETIGRYGDLSLEAIEPTTDGVTATREIFTLNLVAIQAEMPDAIPPHRITTVRISFNPEVLQ